MDDRSKHIDDLFREGLGDYKETPGASVWDSLEQRLPAADAPAAEQPSRRWLWYLLLLLLLATVGYFIIRKVSEESTSIRKPTSEQTEQAVINNNGVALNRGGTSASGPNAAEDDDAAYSQNGSAGGEAGDDAEEEAETSSNTNAGSTGNKTAGSDNKQPGGSLNNFAKSGSGNTAAGSTSSGQAGKTAASTSSSGGSESSGTSKSSGTSTGTSSSDGNSGNSSAAAGANTGGTGKNTGNNSSDGNTGTDAGKTTNNTGATANAATKAANSPAGKAPPAANKTNNTSTASSTANETAGKKANAGKNKTTAKPSGKPDKLKVPEAKGKPVTTEPATAKNKPVTITPVADEKKGLTVPAVANTKKTVKPLDENTSKNNVVKLGSANKGQAPTVTTKTPPSTPPPNAAFKKTKEGFQIAVPDEDEKEVAVAANVELEEPEEEEKELIEEEEVEMPKLATGSNPGGGGGGGGGAAEPNVALRNFSTIKLEGGIKAGYEMSFNKLSTGSPVISPYVQWNISPKVAFLVMPSFRYNRINMLELFAQQAYHRITGAVFDSLHIPGNDTFQGPTIQRNYFYKNTYDSILAGYKINEQKFWEIDLPLLLKYRLSPKISMLVGPYLTFGNLIQISGDFREFNGLSRTDTISYAPVPDSNNPGQVGTYPNPPGLANYFTYNTPAYTGSVSQAEFRNPATNPARFGLMFGLSFEMGKRILVDLLVRQNLSDMRYIPNEQVRKAYTTPYMRVTVGVKLFDTEKKDAKPINGL